ncbi:hypothetical protein [Reichenbachiella sp.]|uniref:hypothetical protein n=1 Tax=Reichenbachiella sp. TaxID=2184521 RepID=UPI003B59B90B
MNKVKNAFLAIVFVLPMLFVATSCDDDEDDNGWTDAEKEQLVSECVSDESGTEEQCQCFADQVTNEFSKSQFENEDFSDADAFKLLEIISDCGILLSFG